MALISYFLVTLPIFNLLPLAFCFLQSPTKIIHSTPGSNSFTFGLTHSRTAMFRKHPSGPIMAANTESESVLSVMEPLRSIRDGYLMSLNLGTPPQVIQVYLDTGSDLTWVPCVANNIPFNCIECDQYHRTSKIPSAFSPLYSSSSLRDFCTSSFCTQIHNSDNPYDPCVMAGCSLTTLIKGTCSRPCPSFAYTYGGGNVVIGTIAMDSLKVHGSNNTAIDIQRFRFGCVGSTYREPLGIAGFGRGSLSLPSQLGFLEKGFSHCFVSFKYAGNPNISSPLVIGDMANSSKESSKFTPMLSNPTYPNYYYIGLEAITISNMSSKQAPTTMRRFDSKGNGGMMIDSGTTYTHLPEPFYSEFLIDLQSVIDYPRALEQEKQTGFDLCYEIPCPNNNRSFCLENDDLPSITFHFINDVSLVLPNVNNFYAVRPPSNFTVVKCLLYQVMDDADDSEGPAAIFGSFQQQNIEVVYDLENDRIGFKPMDCATAGSTQALHRHQ